MPHHLLDVVEPGPGVLGGRVRAPGAGGTRARSPRRGRLPIVAGRNRPVPEGAARRASSRARRATRPAPTAREPWPTATATRRLHRLLARVDARSRDARRRHATASGSCGPSRCSSRPAGPSRTQQRRGRRAPAGLPQPWSSGLDPDRDGAAAGRRAPHRAMLAGGLVDEVRALLARGYRRSLRPLRAIGYRQAVAVARGGAEPRGGRRRRSSPRPCASRSGR